MAIPWFVDSSSIFKGVWSTKKDSVKKKNNIILFWFMSATFLCLSKNYKIADNGNLFFINDYATTKVALEALLR